MTLDPKPTLHLQKRKPDETSSGDLAGDPKKTGKCVGFCRVEGEDKLPRRIGPARQRQPNNRTFAGWSERDGRCIRGRGMLLCDDVDEVEVRYAVVPQVSHPNVFGSGALSGATSIVRNLLRRSGHIVPIDGSKPFPVEVITTRGEIAEFIVPK